MPRWLSCQGGFVSGFFIVPGNFMHGRMIGVKDAFFLTFSSLLHVHIYLARLSVHMPCCEQGCLSQNHDSKRNKITFKILLSRVDLLEHPYV